MRRLPTLRQLRFMVSLEKHLHFSKAAEECCVTQSAFSIAFRELEETLGAKLAERSSRSVVFTPLGQEAVEYARRIVAEAENMVDIVASRSKPLAGALRLGVIPTIAPFMLPKALKKILRAHPDLKLSVKEDLTHKLYRDLIYGELDLILVALPFDFKSVVVLPLFRDDFLLGYKRGTALFDPAHYSEENLPDASILLLEDGHCLRDHALSACKLKNESKISRYTTSNLHTLVQMVNSDLGITFVPRIAIAGGLLAKTDVEVQAMSSSAYREIGFVWRKESVREKEFRLFAEPFRELGPGDVKVRHTVTL